MLVFYALQWSCGSVTATCGQSELCRKYDMSSWTKAHDCCAMRCRHVAAQKIVQTDGSYGLLSIKCHALSRSC
jgi:hypothetical protein